MIEICKKLAEVQEMLRANPNSGVLGIHLVYDSDKPTISVHMSGRKFDELVGPNYDVAPNYAYEEYRRRSFDYPIGKAATIRGITVEALYSEQACSTAPVE